MMTKTNDLPTTVDALGKKIDDLEQLIRDLIAPKSIECEFLTVEETVQFLHLKKPTIYAKVGEGSIPHIKRGGRLYFKREDLINYLEQGRRKTTAELEAEVEEELSNLKEKRQ